MLQQQSRHIPACFTRAIAFEISETPGRVDTHRILLKEKRGLGDCPQGFVFDFKQKGFHVPLLTLFLSLNKKVSSFRLLNLKSKTKSKEKIEAFDLK